MKKLILTGLSVGLMTLLAAPAMAHGGQYRGPGDVVPPAPGGGRGRTPGAAGPTTGSPNSPNPGPPGPITPGQTGPGTGSPAGTGNPGRPTTPRGGIILDSDLTRWEFWWEFNKDPYIRLRDAIHQQGTTSGDDNYFMGGGRTSEASDTLKPSEGQILDTILPKLKEAMDATDNRDITSSCLIAMAKIGKNKPGEIDILEIMKSKLTDGDQEIRETAALSLGISQLTDAVDDLIELATDSPKGRAMCDRGEVDDRTRTFSAYALGLVAHETTESAIKELAFDALAQELAKKDIPSRNLRVGLVNGIALINPDVYDHAELAQKCLEVLEEYYTRNAGKGELLMQSHCPLAVAKILGNNGPVAAEGEDPTWWQNARSKWMDMMLLDLNGKVKQRDANEISMSAALTLGQMGTPVKNLEANDAKYAKALHDYFQKGTEQQTKYFSLMAMGQMGGEWNRDQLLKILRKGLKALERPWAAVALGVFAFERHEKAEKSGGGGMAASNIGEAIEQQLDEASDPQAAGGFAVALGLCKYKDAADKMRDLLNKNSHQDIYAGYLAIGLALMDDQDSVEDIRRIVGDSVRRPELLQQAAVALGKLGDKDVAKQLQSMMNDGDQNLAKMSAIASALGFIGDRRSITPLADMLFDEDMTELTRAFAAVALGGIADKEQLPWNSKIAVNLNYRAAVETLTNGQLGILDIL